MEFEEFVDLCADADTLIKVVKKKTWKLQGRRPSNVKAAAIHHLARQKGLPITLNKLYSVYGCMQKTIIEIEKIISSAVND